MWNTFEETEIEIVEDNRMNKNEWILCPICGGKTRDRIREDTV